MIFVKIARELVGIDLSMVQLMHEQLLRLVAVALVGHVDVAELVRLEVADVGELGRQVRIVLVRTIAREMGRVVLNTATRD